MREYNIFISHSWQYSDAYNKLINLLDNSAYFSYKNYSVPKDDPLTIRNKIYYESELENKIEKQMRPCSVVLILAGVYSSFSESIDMEIKIANRLSKPIIAIEPYGSQRTSFVVKNNAKKVVSWNSSSIINAIKELTL